MTAGTSKDLMVGVEALWRERVTEVTGPLQTVCGYAMEGGRRVRAALLLAAVPGAGEAAVRAAAALEMMHTATLLQDDIFDRADLRRGRAAVHAAFGKALAILASDWLLLSSLELAAETGPAYFRSLSRAGRAMAEAEAAELAAEAPHSAGEAERLGLAIARGKTGRLFGAALCGAAVVCGVAESGCAAWEALGTEMGVTYQMVDDCVDVYAGEESCGKSVGHDVAAGCLTLPVLLGMSRLKEGPGPGQLMASVRSAEVRWQMATLIEGRMQSHRAEARRVGLEGPAWEAWGRALLRRAADTLCVVEANDARLRPGDMLGWELEPFTAAPAR